MTPRTYPTKFKLSDYEIAVDEIRKHGPMDRVQLASRLGWPLKKVSSSLTRARMNFLLATRSKHGRLLVYSAVQTSGWPHAAPDTESQSWMRSFAQKIAGVRR